MKIPIQISEESREPIYHQIETQLKTMIATGKLLPNTPLPSIRALASDLGCSVITTRRVYQNLEMAGFIKTIQGKGTFVKQIETVELEKTKEKVVFEALDKVIDQGVQLGVTRTELESIFQEVIKKYYRKEG